MFTSRIYSALSDDCRTVRKAVFMEEQGFENEFDKTDEIALHIVVYDEQGLPAGTGRIFIGEDGCWYIGRVAVLKKYRGLSLGSMIVRGLEEAAAERGADRVRLWAQCRASGFYEKLGYSQTGRYHDDEGCPHVLMERRI